jgi:hypothetical protein
MIVSDSNPLQWWLTPLTNVTTIIDLAALGVTFNTEDKDNAVEYHPYFHILKSDDVITTEMVVDDPDADYILSIRTKDGALFEDFEFVFDAISGSHFRCVIDLSDMPEMENQMPFFVIINDTTGKILAVTDHHKVKTEFRVPSLLISYSNSSPFNNILADVDMAIRIPAVFIVGNFPEEIEDEDLSDGTIVSLTASVKTQRLLAVELLPDYEHLKLKYILKCTDLVIKGLNWKQEDAYELADPPHPKYEMRRGKVFLTLDGSIVRSVYTT